jgi:DNA polymerase alpha subunit A
MQNIERKGLDMVRRDWSLLSKEIGDFCLNQILSGGQAFKYLFLD